MPKGKVKFFNAEKGFGFITDDSGKDIFVHVTGLIDSDLREGDTVEFETKEGKKGLNAVNVAIVD